MEEAALSESSASGWGCGHILLLSFLSYLLFALCSRARHSSESFVEGWRGTKFWKSFGEYFDSQIILDVNKVREDGSLTATPADRLDAEKRYVFALYPHHAMSVGHLLSFTDANGFSKKVFAGQRRHAMATPLFLIPFVRELCLRYGGVDVGRPTFEKMMKEGISMFVLPGGETEQVMAQYQREEIFIRHRKGFVRLAVKYGFSVVPIYCFGEADVYNTSSALLSFRKWLVRNLRIGLPLVYGRWGLLPYKVPFRFVVGQPIDPSSSTFASLSEEERVDAVHSAYISGLQHIFDKYKADCGAADRNLYLH